MSKELSSRFEAAVASLSSGECRDWYVLMGAFWTLSAIRRGRTAEEVGSSWEYGMHGLGVSEGPLSEVELEELWTEVLAIPVQLSNIEVLARLYGNVETDRLLGLAERLPGMVDPTMQSLDGLKQLVVLSTELRIADLEMPASLRLLADRFRQEMADVEEELSALYDSE